MSGKRLRVGLIGLGALGRNHARVLASLDGVELVGIVDPYLAPVDAGPRQRALAPVARLLALGLDYAVVACPTTLHEQVGLELADAGVNALFDRPLADSIDAARRLVEAFESSGLVAAVGQLERLSPAVQNLRLRLEFGELGGLFQVVTRRQGRSQDSIASVGTGIVQDLAAQDIDLTSWVTGQEYLSVAAQMISNIGNRHEDVIAVVGQLVDGTSVSHVLNWLSPVTERYTAVSGERGCFVADTSSGGLTFYPNGAVADGWEPVHALRATSGQDAIRYAIPKREPLRVEHELYRDAVAGASSEIVTLAQGLRRMEASTALLLSLDCGSTLPAPRRTLAMHGS